MQISVIPFYVVIVINLFNDVYKSLCKLMLYLSKFDSSGGLRLLETLEKWLLS